MNKINRKKLFCFIHIERSGGTSIHHSIRNIIYTYYSVPTFGGKYGPTLNADDINAINKCFPFIKGLGGHTLRSYLGYEKYYPNIRYFTFLREPIKRYLSQYNYILAIFNKSMGFDEYLKIPKYYNFQVNKICGEINVQKAINELSERYSFIGNADKNYESMCMLGNLLEVKRLVIFNKNKIGDKLSHYITLDDLSEHQLKIAKQNNEMDIELFEYFNENIYPKQIKKYGNYGGTIKYSDKCQSEVKNSKIKKYLVLANRYLISHVGFNLILRYRKRN